LLEAAVLAGGHHERNLLLGVCAWWQTLGEVSLVQRVRRRGWDGVACRISSDAKAVTAW
jgi:hypothetical protein